MKNFSLTIIILLFLAVRLSAQTPNAISYQGVARNASGLVLPNQSIGLQFIVHQGSAGGTAVYQETQTTTTNQLGLFTVSIGKGVVVSGTFAGISWGSSQEYLEVDMDPTGGTAYVTMGTNQFLSVPYALNSGTSNTSWNISGNANTTGANYIGTSDGNDVVFKANSNEVMRIANATGNVGIGTTTPNAGAALDVSSATKGMMIPRLSANPASPANGMMYYNTSTNCMMVYMNNYWDAVVCPCPNAIATPTSISEAGGLTTFCPSTTGVVFSTPAISNATTYTWVITTTTGGATITGGQGTNVITVTTGTAATTLKVTATNNCGSSTQFVSGNFTLVAVPAISLQPQSQNINVGSPVTFSVTASNSPTYQWQVNTGSGFTAIPGANSSSYTIASVTSGMNNYVYNVLVTGPCGTLTSSSATLGTCSGPVGPATAIVGSTSVCASTTGVSYSIPTVANATFYTWTLPGTLGSVVPASSNNSITVNMSTTSGTIMVVPQNACGVGTSSSQAITINPTTAITVQPANTTGTTASASFSVGAVGGGLTYQWLLSTDGGTTYNPISNGAPYSGVTTSTLSIANPTVPMESYKFKVTVNGTCGSGVTSTTGVSITSICASPGTPSVPITIHNTAGTATSANLSVLISPINFSTYAGNIDAGFDNIEFTSGASAGNGGTQLYAWIESGSALSSGSATVPTAASTAGIVWVNIPTSIGAGATITIYMNFMSSPVMTSNTSLTGIAPQLTSTYGQYDNGALVFPTFYDNFAGNTLSSNWANNYHSTNGTITVNNGLSLSVPATGSEAAVISSANIFTPPVVAESYVSSPPNIGALRSYMPGLVSLNASAAAALEGVNLTDNYPNAPFDSYVCFSDGRAFGIYSWLQGATTSPSPYADYDIYGGSSTGTPPPTGYNVYALYYNPTANSLYKNYSLACNGTATYSPTAGTKMYFTLGQDEVSSGTALSLMSYWARIRVYPPSGTEPTVAIGSFGCN